MEARTAVTSVAIRNDDANVEPAAAEAECTEDEADQYIAYEGEDVVSEADTNATPYLEPGEVMGGGIYGNVSGSPCKFPYFLRYRCITDFLQGSSSILPKPDKRLFYARWISATSFVSPHKDSSSRSGIWRMAITDSTNYAPSSTN